MTKRQALEVLILHAAENCHGVGCGIRSIPSEAERARVREAVQKVYRDAYGRRAMESDLHNLRLY